ncbi:MAG: hypothetical protein V1745_04125 [Patescibacteria group bacterium]
MKHTTLALQLQLVELELKVVEPTRPSHDPILMTIDTESTDPPSADGRCAPFGGVDILTCGPGGFMSMECWRLHLPGAKADSPVAAMTGFDLLPPAFPDDGKRRALYAC